MDISPLIINVLLAIIGFLVGVGTSHIFILRKVNSHDVTLEQHTTRLRAVERSAETAHSHHDRTLELLTNVVNQNNLLIQKITVERT